MEYVTVEASGFAAPREEYFGSDAEFAAFQAFLTTDPLAGTVIRGAGGIRKVRWTGRGHGKRGGLRVIYLHLPRHNRLYLLDVYAKGEQEDLSPDDLRVMATIAEQIRTTLDNRQGR